MPPVHKALLIGITYPGTPDALGGCANDCAMVYSLLKDNGYDPENIVFLRDDEDGGREEEFMPTKANILKHIEWLVSNNRADDKLFFHYSGHGASKVDTTGTEADGMMEYLCPCDDQPLTDDELNAALVSKVQEGVSLYCLIDACRSGTVLDLPYCTYMEDGENSWIQVEDEEEKGCHGRVVQFSGCHDSQVSSDLGVAGLATLYFYQAVTVMHESKEGGMTFDEVLKHMQQAAVVHQKARHEAKMATMTAAERSRYRAELLADKMQEKMHAGEFGKEAAKRAGTARRTFLANCQVPQISSNYAFDLEDPFEM